MLSGTHAGKADGELGPYRLPKSSSPPKAVPPARAHGGSVKPSELGRGLLFLYGFSGLVGRKLGQPLGDRGGEAEDSPGRHAHGDHVETAASLPLWRRFIGRRILPVAPQHLARHPRILDVEGDDQVVVDDLVQRPVGGNLLESGLRHASGEFPRGTGRPSFLPLASRAASAIVSCNRG